MKQIDSIINNFKDKQGTLIEILQQVQDIKGYLSLDNMKYIAERTGIAAAEIYGVATFYSQFKLKAQGRHIIKICKGTACHVSGADTIAAAVRSQLKLEKNEDTTADGRFSVMEVSCLGCCSLSPVIMVDEDTHGKLTVGKLAKILDVYK